MKKINHLKNVLRATVLIDCYKCFTTQKDVLAICIGFKGLERLESVIEMFKLKPDGRSSNGEYHFAIFHFTIK